MATSASEEKSITASHESSGLSVNNTLTEPISRVRDKHTSRQRRMFKFRGIGSSSVLFILIWNFIICLSFSITLHYLYHLTGYSSTTVRIEDGAYIIVVAVSLPIVSLLAEVVISRYKLLSYSLRAMWILSIITCVLSITEYSLPTTTLILSKIWPPLCLLPLPITIGAFLSSAIPLGIDQIITGSNDNISSFIQWMVWSSTVGTSFPGALNHIVFWCTQYQDTEISMIVSLLPVLLLSIGLILDFRFSQKLVQEPVTVNPVTLIFKVLKYAAKHKYPVRRSAFTYCDNQQPSRLDYGKTKYGGPFTTEQVEDVKTFWRVLLVLLTTSLSFPTIVVLYNIALEPNCVTYIYYTFTSYASVIVYSIPLYELLVYPCLRNRSPRILQSLGIGAAALIISSLYGLTAETILYFTTNGTSQCLFTPSITCFTIYIPFNAITGFAAFLLVKSSLEFICAQAPYNMRNILIGFHITAVILLTAPGALLHFLWKEKIAVLEPSRYGMWFYLTTLVLGVVSSVLLGCVLRWYKGRERDEIVNYQAMVEDIYDKYQQQEVDQRH